MKATSTFPSLKLKSEQKSFRGFAERGANACDSLWIQGAPR